MFQTQNIRKEHKVFENRNYFLPRTTKALETRDQLRHKELNHKQRTCNGDQLFLKDATELVSAQTFNLWTETDRVSETLSFFRVPDAAQSP
jgi:hypothetical protein